jgi:DNA modification methylase
MSLLANPFRNRVLQGDCIEVMRQMETASVDFILTDPPYICRYRSRTGETLTNDDNEAWLQPAFAEMYRVLKDKSFCLSFYGWNKVDVFMHAWRSAGFRPVGHLVFPKQYASSSRFVRCHHEQAFLLGGDVSIPKHPPADVVDWVYTGNRLHPTQKSARMLQPLIEAFCKPDGIVLDPFCGSGSTLIAANDNDRDFIGIELDRRHHQTASLRLNC